MIFAQNFTFTKNFHKKMILARNFKFSEKIIFSQTFFLLNDFYFEKKY